MNPQLKPKSQVLKKVSAVRAMIKMEMEVNMNQDTDSEHSDEFAIDQDRRCWKCCGVKGSKGRPYVDLSFLLCLTIVCACSGM